MRLRERLLGAQDRLGWWLVPLFAITGLAGAVLAGSLAVVYYAQQVNQLERETAAAREDLATAVDDVQSAADEALEAIGSEVDAVRDRLVEGLPVPEPLERGVVRLTVEAEVAAPQPEVSPDPDDEPSPEPERIDRTLNGFVIARDGDDVFVLTSFSLLQDPQQPDVPLDVAVRVATGGGEVEGRPHNWDAERDLLLIRTQLPELEPLEWRPADSGLSPGDRVVAVGLTPSLGAAQVGGEVAVAEEAGMVTDLPRLDLLNGAPLVDVDGRVVGMVSPRYRAFSADPAVVPIRLVCGDLLRSCPE